jgi:hypothetical protein
MAVVKRCGTAAIGPDFTLLLRSRVLVAFQTTCSRDADCVIQRHRGARCAARLEVQRLVAEFAQGGFKAWLERRIAAVVVRGTDLPAG